MFRQVVMLKNHTSSVNSLALTSNNQFVVSESWDKTVR